MFRIPNGAIHFHDDDFGECTYIYIYIYIHRVMGDSLSFWPKQEVTNLVHLILLEQSSDANMFPYLCAKMFGQIAFQLEVFKGLANRTHQNVKLAHENGLNLLAHGRPPMIRELSEIPTPNTPCMAVWHI